MLEACCTKLSLAFQSFFIVLVKYGLTLFIKLFYVMWQGSKMLICTSHSE